MEKIKNLIIKKLRAAKKYKSSRVNELYQKYKEIYNEKKNMEEEQIIKQISSDLDAEIKNYEPAPRFLFLLCASVLMQFASILEIILCDSSYAIYIMPIVLIAMLLGLFYKKNRYLSDYLILLLIIIGFQSTMTRIFYFWGKLSDAPHYYSRSIQFIFPCIYQVTLREFNLMNYPANLLNLNWLISFIMIVITGVLYILERKNKLVLREEGINYGLMTILCCILFGCSILESLSFLFPGQGAWVLLICMSLGVIGLMALCIASIFVKKIKLGTIVFTILLLGVWLTSLCYFLVVNHPYYGMQNPFYGECFVNCFSLMAYHMKGLKTIHYSMYLNFLVSLIMGVIFASKYAQALPKDSIIKKED